MDYSILNTELTTDPLGRGYAGMTAEQATDDLNTVYRDKNRTSMLGSEIWENTDAADFAALSDAKKSEWISFCGIESVDPFGPAAAFVTYVFTSGNTISNLATARVELASRANELLYESVKTAHVVYARTL